MKFKKLKELFYSIKITKETERAILFEVTKEKGSKNNPAPKYSTWIPKDCLGFERKKPTLLIDSFNLVLEEIVEEVIGEKPNSFELPEYYDVYNNALKKKLDVQRIGSHLILKVNKESTKLKDLFVESGGERNYNTFTDELTGDDFYIFYAQFKPYFEDKLKKDLE